MNEMLKHSTFQIMNQMLWKRALYNTQEETLHDVEFRLRSQVWMQVSHRVGDQTSVNHVNITINNANERYK